MRKTFGIIAMISVSLAIVTPAGASEQPSSGMRVSLMVPEVCEIHAPVIAVDESDGVATGSVFEMCNSGRAFSIVASHRTLSENEDIDITYAGQTRQLQESGTSIVASRSGPSARSAEVKIEPKQLTGSLAISLGIMAI